MLPDDSDAHPAATAKLRRRRSLRQALFVRRQYEGHRVPDRPTSMGERLRVLPPEYPSVAEEQILQSARRRRALFADDPGERLLTGEADRIWRASLDDLSAPGELAELGTAYFLDRPCGVFKEPSEVDRTPLVSSRAVSRAMIESRLKQMQAWGWLTAEYHAKLQAMAGALTVIGVPLEALVVRPRPGVVSLGDAATVASDFRFVAAGRSLGELLRHYDWNALQRSSAATAAWLASGRSVVLFPHAPADSPSDARLRFYDPALGLRLELGWVRPSPASSPYRERLGVEWVDRLRVLDVWEPTAAGDLAHRPLVETGVWIPLRDDCRG